MDVIERSAQGSGPNFAALAAATANRSTIRFEDQPRTATTPTTRTLEPWAVLTLAGRLFVVGLDRDRQLTAVLDFSAIDNFRLGQSDAFTAPDESAVAEAVAAALRPAYAQ
jgi:predicted DNA-binding transcriptional regulator YafY